MVEICGNAQLCHTELVEQQVTREVANEEEQDEDEEANYEDGEKRLAALLLWLGFGICRLAGSG